SAGSHHNGTARETLRNGALQDGICRIEILFPHADRTRHIVRQFFGSARRGATAFGPHAGTVEQPAGGDHAVAAQIHPGRDRSGDSLRWTVEDELSESRRSRSVRDVGLHGPYLCPCAAGRLGGFGTVIS